MVLSDYRDDGRGTPMPLQAVRLPCPPDWVYLSHAEGMVMGEDMQALFMQARIVRLANGRWGISLAEAARLLLESGALEYVREGFDYFHLEGDQAVLDDVEDYLLDRGVRIHAVT